MWLGQKGQGEKRARLKFPPTGGMLIGIAIPKQCPAITTSRIATQVSGSVEP